MAQLPEFRGWTVDERLEEFRRVWMDDEGNPHMETLSFFEPEGDRLLGEYIIERAERGDSPFPVMFSND